MYQSLLSFNVCYALQIDLYFQLFLFILLFTTTMPPISLLLFLPPSLFPALFLIARIENIDIWRVLTGSEDLSHGRRLAQNMARRQIAYIKLIALPY